VNDTRPRSEILREAETLINGDRAQAYGPLEENFGRIAAGWAVIFGVPVTPEQVARAMAWLKIARLNEGPHRDSYVDGAAYMALAGELGLAKKFEET
jgi:hypothetical protein